MKPENNGLTTITHIIIAAHRRLLQVENLKQEYKRNQILSRAFIDVNIMDGLNARSQVHYIFSNLKFNDYEDTKLARVTSLLLILQLSTITIPTLHGEYVELCEGNR